MTKVKNILRHALSPASAGVLVRKLLTRLEPNTAEAATAWAEERATSMSEYCAGADSELWAEAQREAEALKSAATSVLDTVGVTLGGAGSYPLVYFLVRKRRPELAVETGVGAGWTTRAILTAMAANGGGHLLSSDFPYVRIDKAEEYIGILVPDGLKSNWTLDTRGDAVAIPRFLQNYAHFDFLHYDSDKSYCGRNQVVEQLIPRMSDDAVFIMDDIQDNTFFKDFVEKYNLDCRVFEFGGKYVGLIDRIGAQAADRRDG